MEEFQSHATMLMKGLNWRLRQKKKLGDAYSVKKTILYNPKIKIVGFSEELNEENLRNCLIQQNLSLKNISGTFKLITCKKMKKII
jgi:hypothetical protein